MENRESREAIEAAEPPPEELEALANAVRVTADDLIEAFDEKEKPRGEREARPIDDVEAALAALHGDDAVETEAEAEAEPARSDGERKRRSRDAVVEPNRITEIALEQLREISSSRRRAQPRAEAKGGDISSLVDEWSDDETPHRPPKRDRSSAGGLVVERAARVIKKKIIWDPDNPATFKFASSAIRKKPVEDFSSAARYLIAENENGDDVELSPLPKRPTPPKRKKMTEVDKLLMDEGAVNMIYQLEKSNGEAGIPEIKPDRNSMISLSKERKHLMNKTKLVKSSIYNVTNPRESTERPTKVFRARKSRAESDNSAPLESSIGELGPDESRIIRRHSSSSFSSECASPKPSLVEDANDVDASTNGDVDKKRAFKGYKRKKSTTEKFTSPKRRNDVGVELETASFARLSVDKRDDVVRVSLKRTPTSGLLDSKVLTELAQVVDAANKIDIKVLLITSENGTICSGLDLHSVVNLQSKVQKLQASQILDHFGNLVLQLAAFSGILIIGINGECCGLGVSLLNLADLTVASDSSTFSTSNNSKSRLPTEGMTLFKLNDSVSSKMVYLHFYIDKEGFNLRRTIHKFVFCENKLTADQALQFGLISHILSTNSFEEELNALIGDFSPRPRKILELTKSTLGLHKINQLEDILQHENNLLSKFWCSSEGQDAIQSVYSSNL